MADVSGRTFDAIVVGSGASGGWACKRLAEAGLKVDEVPVDMRPRASGESKLRGWKSLLVVFTVIGTLLTFWRRRR